MMSLIPFDRICYLPIHVSIPTIYIGIPTYIIHKKILLNIRFCALPIFHVAGNVVKAYKYFLLVVANYFLVYFQVEFEVASIQYLMR